MTVVDLFAGPGGWDTGLRDAGYTGQVVGIEWDKDACDTARAAGHERIHADVSLIHPELFGYCEGHIGSPPCQGFSPAGKGNGRQDATLLLQSVRSVASLSDLEGAIDLVSQAMADKRSILVLEPLRWALAMRPKWIAWEQVPTVLPIWEACAEVLRRQGYSVDTGVLSAEQYGVPQTRRRAILVASLADVAMLPKPTHSRYVARNPRQLESGLAPWVSMAQALGWGDELVGFPRKSDGRQEVLIGGVAYRARDLRPTGVPAQTVTEKARSWLRMGNQRNATERETVLPAPTVFFGARVNEVSWTFAEAGELWTRRVTVEEAAQLQSFPADYPWRGSMSGQFRQVGDAVPPKLAARVLAPLLTDRRVAA